MGARRNCCGDDSDCFLVPLCNTDQKKSSAVIQTLHSKGYLKFTAIMKIVVSAIITVFCASIGISGWSTLTYAIDQEVMTQSLLIPYWPFYLILMVGFCLMAFVAFLQLIEDLISLLQGKYVDEQIEFTTDV